MVLRLPGTEDIYSLFKTSVITKEGFNKVGVPSDLNACWVAYPSQTTTTGVTLNPLVMGTIVFDNNDLIEGKSANKILIREEGVYLVTGYLQFEYHNTGYRRYAIYKDPADGGASTIICGYIINAVSSGNYVTFGSISGLVEVKAGDEIFAAAQQNSGGDLDAVGRIGVRRIATL